MLRTRVVGRYVDCESPCEVWIVPARTRWRWKRGHRAEIRRWTRADGMDWELQHKTKVRATVGEAIEDAGIWLTEHGLDKMNGEPDG